MVDDHSDADLDGAATGDDDVISASVSQISREFDALKKKSKALSRKNWKQRPVRTFFQKVAMPSTLLGLAAYGLSYANGDPNVKMAAVSGALWYPAHSIREPISRFLGKVDGSIRNVASSFNGNASETYFQQKTQEIRYEGWSDGAVTAGLLTGAVLLPTYGALVADTAVSLYNGASYLKDVIVEGVRAVNTPSPQ